MKKHAVVVISDIHLGGNNCNIDYVLRVLKKESTDVLIINGDLFDSGKLHRLSKAHWKVLSTIRKLSKKTKIVLVRGNHDAHKTETLQYLLGVEVVEEYSLTINGINYLFIHGDRFDFSMVYLKPITKIIGELYHQLCKLSWIKKKINGWIHKIQSNTYTKDGALRYKKSKNVNWICCGHSHIYEKDDIAGYLNSGTFCNDKPTYITIDFSGIPSIIIGDGII